MKIIRTELKKLAAPYRGYTLHWADDLPGFGVRVTASGAVSFIVQKRINGRDKRLTIGAFPTLTPEQARKHAHKLLADIATGGDPVAAKRRRVAEAVTLNQALNAYLEARKTLKPLTVKDIHRAVNETFPDWLNKPLLAITRDMVAKRHTQAGSRSEARANLAMRYLRAIFNFAAGEYTDAKGNPIITDNPVKRLSQTRAWYKVDRRQTVIKAHQLELWMRAVMQLEQDTARDYFMLVLCTGLRRTEALCLKWENMDLTSRTLTVHDTKNHQSHTLPLSSLLIDILQRRHAARASEWVFPAIAGSGHYQGPTQAVRRVVKVSGVDFTIHDLRRTFATVAESLDIPAYALKMLLNHKTGADVTQGYIVTDVERLRIPMQKITDYMLKAGGLLPSAEIMPFKNDTKQA